MHEILGPSYNLSNKWRVVSIGGRKGEKGGERGEKERVSGRQWQKKNQGHLNKQKRKSVCERKSESESE